MSWAGAVMACAPGVLAPAPWPGLEHRFEVCRSRVPVTTCPPFELWWLWFCRNRTVWRRPRTWGLGCWFWHL